jgi:hypothetical protein
MVNESEVMVRVPAETLKQLREAFPELNRESNATVVRTILAQVLQNVKRNR